MKKILLSSFIVIASLCNTNAQNTIPTTTVTGALKINDSLRVNKNITAKGEILVKDTLRAKKDVIVDGNVNIDGKIKVKGNARFKDDVRLEKGFTFDGTTGLFRAPATSTSGEIIQLGDNSAKPLPYFYCQAPNTEPWNQFYYNGNFVSYLPAGSNISAPLVDAAVRIGVAPWNGNGVIDVSGVDNNGLGNNGLDINYFCKRNTSINRGWDLNPNNFVDGGTVYLGAKVDMQSSLKLGWTPSGNIDLNTSIEINQNTANAKGVNVKTYEASIKAFAIERTDGKNNFIVYGNGKTQIGLEKPQTPHTDALLSVAGKIACKSLYVLKPTSWADFVFKKKEIETLANVEKYIRANKHLPGIPSEEEVMKNGYDINDMNAKLLEKIENLYLYVIALEKEIDLLKKK
jgi:hypothetical protein